MNFASLSDKIKDKLNQGADKFLSSEVKEELGLNKPTIDSLYSLSEDQNLDDNLNNFYKPVNSTFLSQRQYKKIQNWGVIVIAVVSVLLIFLFISMVVPHKNFNQNANGVQVFVKGDEVKAPEDKIKEITIEESQAEGANQELKVEDINIENVDQNQETQKLVKSSPLLKNESLELTKYKIKSGDTLEKVALRFYASSAPKYIEKIKVANKIRNVRLLRVGQEILIPIN